MRFLVTGSQMRALDQHTIEKLGNWEAELKHVSSNATPQFGRFNRDHMEEKNI